MVHPRVNSKSFLEALEKGPTDSKYKAVPQLCTNEGFEAFAVPRPRWPTCSH